MYYNFNGKKLRIPDEEIKKSMKFLNLTQEEAIQMWLEDEGYEINEEQEALEKKGKENHITATIHEAKAQKPKPKTQKERIQKEDPEKEEIIKKLAETVQNCYGNAQITNKNKLISFKIDENDYEINLIRKRKPKNETI